MIHHLVVYLISTCSQNLKFQYQATVHKKFPWNFRKYHRLTASTSCRARQETFQILLEWILIILESLYVLDSIMEFNNSTLPFFCSLIYYTIKKRKGVCVCMVMYVPIMYVIWIFGFCIQALQADILGHNKDKRSTTQNVLQSRTYPVMLAMISMMSNTNSIVA